MKIYLLFQTDIYLSKQTRVFFGAFEHFDAANQAAEDNDLYSPSAGVEIVEAELNNFEEI